MLGAPVLSRDNSMNKVIIGPVKTMASSVLACVVPNATLSHVKELTEQVRNQNERLNKDQGWGSRTSVALSPCTHGFTINKQESAGGKRLNRSVSAPIYMSHIWR